MRTKNKRYIVTQSGELYIRENKNLYRHFPDNALMAKENIQRIFTETNDVEEVTYDACCRGCYYEKRCHDDCEHHCIDDEDSKLNKIQAYLEEEI